MQFHAQLRVQLWKTATEVRSVCNSWVFTARSYASAVYAVVVCPFFRPSVCLSHAGIVLKRLYVETRKQRRTIA